jgi:hypothetical protein
MADATAVCVYDCSVCVRLQCVCTTECLVVDDHLLPLVAVSSIDLPIQLEMQSRTFIHLVH